MSYVIRITLHDPDDNPVRSVLLSPFDKGIGAGGPYILVGHVIVSSGLRTSDLDLQLLR